MRRLSMLSAILILMLLLGLTFAAGVPAQAPEGKAQPVENLAKESLPLAGGVPEAPCGDIEGPISCGDTVHVDTTDNENLMGGYSCIGWDESGPEELYVLTLPPGASWDVEVSMENYTVDLDLFVLGGACDSENCVEYGDTWLGFNGAGEETYWISVDGYAGAAGEADITITCAEGPEPAMNDDCADATVVLSLPFSSFIDTEDATTAGDDPIISCGGSQHSNTVWFVYTAGQDGLIDLGTCGSNYDTVLAVFEGECGSLTELTCNDDSCGLQSEINDFPVTAGNTYYIEVADFGGPDGGALYFYMEGEPGMQDPMYAKLRLDVRPPMGPWGYRATALAAVRDAIQGVPLEGAEVTFFLKNPEGTEWFETAFTDSRGIAQAVMEHPTGGPWRACLEDVTYPGYLWDPDPWPRCRTVWFGDEPPPGD